MLQAFKLATLLKRDFNTGFFCEYGNIANRKTSANVCFCKLEVKVNILSEYYHNKLPVLLPQLD